MITVQVKQSWLQRQIGIGSFGVVDILGPVRPAVNANVQIPKY